MYKMIQKECFNGYVTNGVAGPTFTGSYAVFPGSGGSVTDGATLQALSSFLKEEWKTQGSSELLPLLT